ncbi:MULTISPECIES: sigma-70 family RNA polymerase sigma factor [Crateriforma]|uniref:RNA polymerase sigma factor n=1 Tax=Crateriforma conspicua TaxID=2527996 RepID=A0A5C5XZ45_9PLAN|nr:ECF RNA polymerase sigma-E factor [Crateriforma conspicua]TWT67819.1 ECF RNA polymerase sigma-E factor [Crateriforma conspicua]TWU67251.1 ECF RNA polymerase sigma-E factor [Crateriforma conspicua]
MRYQQSDPDVRLMMRVKEDDAAAFETLVRRYQTRLVRMMQHMGPKGMAEDLAQETFLRVYRARHRYQPGAKFATWLYTIAGNVARNANRSAGRRQEVSEIDAPLPDQPDQPATLLAGTAADASGLMPARMVEKGERAEIVRAAIESLGERQRMALMLSRFENLSYAEIAEAMGMSAKAVKSLLSRARVNLKELLQPYIDAGVLPQEPK